MSLAQPDRPDSLSPTAAQPQITWHVSQQPLELWTVWNLSCLLMWYWFGAAFVNSLAGAFIVPTSTVLLLSPVFSASYLIARQRLLEVILLLGYFVIFPGLALWWLAKRFRAACGRIQKGFLFTTGIVAAVFLCPFMLVCWLGLCFSEDETYISILIVLDLLLNLVILLVVLRLAANPLRPLLELAQLAATLEALIDADDQKKAAQQETREAKQARLNGNLKSLSWYNTFRGWFRRLCITLLKQTIVSAFTLILVLAFFMTTFGYALAMFASQRLSSPAFQGLATNFLTCWAFSISTFMTAPIANVAPISWLGYAIYVTELICTFFVISVFFAIFSTAMGVHGKERSEELLNLCDSSQKWITDRQSRIQADLLSLQ